MGLLSELLSYANIINGLKETQKKELRRELEVIYDMIQKKFEHKYDRDDRELYVKKLSRLGEALRLDKTVLLGIEISKNEKIRTLLCVELCNEYLDYLKKLLKPYLKS